jgi:hypothetical protein
VVLVRDKEPLPLTDVRDVRECEPRVFFRFFGFAEIPVDGGKRRIRGCELRIQLGRARQERYRLNLRPSRALRDPERVRLQRVEGRRRGLLDRHVEFFE